MVRFRLRKLSIDYLFAYCVLIVCSAIVLPSGSWAAEPDVTPATEPAAEESPSPQGPLLTAQMIRIEGMITPLSGAIWLRKFDEAVAKNPDMIILHIDSPGGYLSTTMELIDRLQKTKDIQTVAYIDNEAISGAALTALATDRIVIASSARFGDAGAIVAGSDSAFRYVDAKARSVFVAQVRAIAEASGRSPALAEAMVDKDVTVFEGTHKTDGKRAFFTTDEWESIPDSDEWTKGKPVFEAKENRFLTLNGRRAVELGVANDAAEDLDELATLLDIESPIPTIRPDRWDAAVVVLNHPLVTALLLIVGFGALLFELSAPGIGIGAFLSTLCFTTFFWSRFLGGTSGWLEVLLFVLGLTFIGLEFFVIPGFGIAGVGGIAMLLVSLVMASQHFFIPENSFDWQHLGVSVGTVVMSLLACAVLGIFMLTYSENMPGPLGRFALKPPSAEDLSVASIAASTPEAPGWSIVQVGDLGQSVSALRPSGKAQFGEQFVDVVTEGDFIDPDQSLKIIKKSGTRVVVRSV
ncbi:hypothetical protein FF011L_16440 [Roseimaritima multifibrata]|uniref:NfeD-like C-terminal domain-containing protein n=1 Tax=Roseimaritima multifibrata TaxID=1930274 RepID=A0A517MDC2_9BACT|nr:peptidase [Roseimaritima multifibrata]QDS92890.1 hypothetical protein FF011L_16440 [Roseimaritima multifibrata]